MGIVGKDRRYLLGIGFCEHGGFLIPERTLEMGMVLFFVEITDKS
jgi:hypothetical protein